MTGPGREEHPAACSMQVDLHFGKQMHATDIRKRVDALLFDLTNSLRENGCKLIGHIKGLLDAGERGQLFFSITSFHDEIRYKGEINSEITEAKLSINVIVYAIEEKTVERALQDQLRRQFSEHFEK